MKKEQTKITKKIIYLFLIVLVVVIGFLTITYLLNDPSSTTATYELKVYGNKNGYICLDGETLCDMVVFTIPSETSNAKVLAVSDYQKYLLFGDNHLKVFDTDTKKVTELKFDNKYDEYKLVTDTKDTTLIGVIYKNKNTTGFYNIAKDQIFMKIKNMMNYTQSMINILVPSKQMMILLIY